MGGRTAWAAPTHDAVPVRWARPASLGLGLAWPWMAGHDVTTLLPVVRVSGSVLPRLALDLTVGTFRHDASGRWTMIDAGARWFLMARHTAPYLLVRAGNYHDKVDENGSRNYPYAAGGVGVEYACDCGVVTWAEAGAALMRFTDGVSQSLAFGIYTSVGVGYRVAIP
jgi:hypothetical protein